MSITRYFNDGSCGDDILDDQIMKNIIETFKRQHEDAILITDVKRAQLFTYIFNKCKDMFGETCTVKYKQGDDLGVRAWHIFIRGSEIRPKNTMVFAKEILPLVDCYDITPYLDGSVEMVLSFNNILTEGR